MSLLISLLLLALPARAASVENGSVTLPWQDFQSIYQRGQEKPPEQPPASPRDYTLDNTAYVGQVLGQGDDAWASFKVSVRGQIHKQKGWTLVPLLSTRAALRKATIAGKDAPIFVNGDYYTLVTNQTGAFTVDLEFGLSLSTADGETALSLPLASAGASTLAFSLDSPEAVDFKLANGRGQTVVRNGNTWRMDAALPGTGSLALSWRRDLPQQQEQQQASRVYAESQVLVGVAEGVLQCNAVVEYTVLHQGVDRFRVQLPKDVTVLDVKGAGIRDWTVENGTILVSLNYAAEGAYRLTLDYERPISADLPLPHVLDVARESMFVGVDARSAVELVAGQASGAVSIDVRELPPAILGRTDFPVLLAYKARGAEVRVPLEVRTHPDVDMLVTLVDAAVAEVLVTPDGRRMVKIQYAVRNNRNQFLRLQMPEGAEIWSASVGGKPVKVARADQGVLIPMLRSDSSSGALSGFLVELVYVEKGTPLAEGRGELQIQLPSTNAPTSQVQLSVYMPGEVKYVKRSDEGTLRHVEGFSAAPSLPQLAPEIEAQARREMAVTGNAQAATLAQGVDPVQVNIPLSGVVRYYEKTLALDEKLWASFEYAYKPKKK